MTLPSSGTLDYNSIRAEFGGNSANVTLSTFYRGSGFTYPVPTNAPIPTGTTSQISVSNFYGAKGIARLGGFNATQTQSGGKLPTTFRGAPSATQFFDQAGYFANTNIGNWTTFRSETNVGVNVGLVNWSTAIPVGVARQATVYNASGQQTINISMSNTHGVPGPPVQNNTGASTSWRTGLGGTDSAGSFTPGAGNWPTSGAMYINDSG
jgi:hypothetical protein